MKGKNEQRHPLTGIEVLDLADEKASFCSRLLADWGARVVKVERPGGDPSRNVGPFWGNSPDTERSLSFYYNNANKLGITLNLEHGDGRRIFTELVQGHDVLVESFPAGYLDEIDLGSKVLSEINPRLIHLSISGFGQNGPRKKYKSCDLVASAFGGQMYVSGSPDRPPLKHFGDQSYYSASLFGAIGILLGLRKRASSGKGEYIDVSLQEAVAATLEHVIPHYFGERLISKRQGNLQRDSGFCILPCKDGFILLTSFQQWDTLVEWMDNEGMAEDLKDEKWKTEEYRLKHLDHIVEILTCWTKTHTTCHLFQTGQLMRFPWAPVCSLKEVLSSPQHKARHFFADMDHPGLTEPLKYPYPPFRFGSELVKKLKRAPLIGEDNFQVFKKELGMSSGEIMRLSSIGVI